MDTIYTLYQAVKKLGRHVIIFTGRGGSYWEDTAKWLKQHNIKYTEAYIRPEGNMQKDSIIKKQMFEDNIRGRYYVEFVVDDRNQVVDMWRKELGLTCLQADYGDF